MKKKNATFTAGPDDDGKRIDRILRKLCPDLPLSALYRNLRRGEIDLNGRKARRVDRVRSGDMISLHHGIHTAAASAPLRRKEPAGAASFAEKFQSLILFRDEHILVLNKPYGILVHGKNSLTEMVLASAIAVSAPSLSFRPGPVHRLDRNTTGVQIFSLSLHGARACARLFRERNLKKVYCGLVDGVCANPQSWEDPIMRDSQRRKTLPGNAPDAPLAVTRVLPVATAHSRSLVLFLPETGKTHQIRFQSSLHGHPLCGDKKYGSHSNETRYLLHNCGMATRGGATVFPPLIAEFDPFGVERITALFGKNALDSIYRRVSSLLAP